MWRVTGDGSASDCRRLWAWCFVESDLADYVTGCLSG